MAAGCWKHLCQLRSYLELFESLFPDTENNKCRDKFTGDNSVMTYNGSLRRTRNLIFLIYLHVHEWLMIPFFLFCGSVDHFIVFF